MERVVGWADRHWRWVVALAFVATCAWLLYQRWGGINAFALGDTDDNMRMMEVRAWLNGQGWYDLRQYRLSPPTGANIHWSRIVDLPIAAIIVVGRWFVSGATAEKAAIAIAPLIPYSLLMASLALVTRRLVAPAAFLAALLGLFFAGSTNGMFVPTRIDHHNWQLALLALSMAGLADPRPQRGGMVLGISTAISLAIGLEMIIYLAIAGMAVVLFWVHRQDEERERLASYAVALAGGTAIGFAAFASYANRAPVCDALSPVWLSDAVIAGVLMFGLSRLRSERRTIRLGAAVAAGLVIAAFHALMWPHCLQRLEGVSPEVDQLWLSHVREARPFYKQDRQIAWLIMAMPATGCVGYALLAWFRRNDPALLSRVLACAAICVVATLLLFWQTRAGPAAQLLAIPGGAAIIALLAPRAFKSKNTAVVVLGTSAALLIGAGAAIPAVIDQIPKKTTSPRERQINRANGSCNSMAAMHPVALQPAGTVMTFVDLAPRLIAVTHHSSIAGPYHRNGPAILDAQHFFRNSEAEAHEIARRTHSDYVLICPNMSQSTIYAAETPKGFYMQLAAGKVPAWLQPIDLGKDWPMKMWKVVG
ncbi:AcrB/AcrD/AcrF family protein [Sphingomonas ginkgonis]|uniref:AcrB/AcrD/AcrF family protein n=1 Tax=Sphingomonas ginkgonis TaxID=2315330 RepID=A0A429V6U9_9SPHN|nr:AcrB/AcrD/AcrF family protein [Sphingomonas ginkgonis]RST29681.1 AcrB/AcrD/AcrF family protein [Sphingomonas ginkgonis]